MNNILVEGKRLHDDISAFDDNKHPHYQNVKRAIMALEALRAFIQASLPVIDAWLQTYLDANRTELFLKFWLHHGTLHADVYIDRRVVLDVYPEFAQQWTATVPALVGTTNTTLEDADRQITDYFNQRDPSNCDIEEILAHHKDKRCESNGWFCWYCEDVEHAWDSHLKNQLKASTNLFLNKSLQPAFFVAMAHHQVPADWRPPVERFDEYRGSYRPEHRPRQAVFTNEDLLQDAQRRREPYKKDGKTPYQCMKEVLERVKYDDVWRLEYGMKTEFDAFRFFWAYSSVIRQVIDLDGARCREIQELF
jgi:hypothetical protein